MASIQKRGPHQWRALIRRRGYPIQSGTYETKAEAEAWARDIESEMDKSVFVDRSLAERETFKDIIERYLKTVTPKHKGHESEKMRLDKFLRDESELCQYAMANLRTEHFEDYRDRRLATVIKPATEQGKLKPETEQRKLKPGTVQRELNLLHSIIEHNRRRLALLENPVSNVKRPRVRNERFARLEEGDEEKLLASLDDSRNKFTKPAVILALETAMRRGELLELKWDDVDLAKRTATLHDTKNGDERVVPLSPRAIDVLKALQATLKKDNVILLEKHLLEKRVFPISAQSLKCSWERARKRADLEHFNFHDLRHEAISRLFERGWDAIKVSHVSGHRSMQCLKRYANLKAEDLAKELG